MGRLRLFLASLKRIKTECKKQKLEPPVRRGCPPSIVLPPERPGLGFEVLGLFKELWLKGPTAWSFCRDFVRKPGNPKQVLL